MVSDKELIDHYLLENDLADAGIKLHKNCCGGDVPMYIGASMKSRYFTPIENPDYDSGKPLSPTNQPVIASKDCVLAKLSQALMDMKKSGALQQIYDKHFKKK